MKTLIATVTALALGAGAVAAETYKLTISASHPTVLPWVGQLSTLVVGESNKRLEAMGSEDRIEWTESYGGALYGFKDTLEAVGDGLTDAGWVGTLWEGSKMPLQNITYFTPFVSDDLVETLKGDGPFTVFAPTDAAFEALPEGLVDELLADPSGALTDVLLYHVLSGKVLSTDLMDGMTATTLNGNEHVRSFVQAALDTCAPFSRSSVISITIPRTFATWFKWGVAA